jgi:hypothetical protein
MVSRWKGEAVISVLDLTMIKMKHEQRQGGEGRGMASSHMHG